MRTMAWGIGLVLVGGCFTDSGGTAGPVGTSQGPGTGSGSSADIPTGTSTGTSTGTGTSTSTSTGETGTPTEVTGTGTSTGGVEGEPCDPWAPDCGAGLKCIPYADDGGLVWNANKCVPAGTGVPGESCTVAGSPTSGVDSCAAGAMCWDVDPNLLVGVCYALCAGVQAAPVCPPGSGCFKTNEGVVNVCLRACDPLLPGCEAGEVCVPDGDDQFLCVTAAGDLDWGAPCEFLNQCAPDSMCALATDSPLLCGQDTKFCCLPYCDLSEKESCKVGLTCKSYFPEGEAPPQLVDLGLCQSG